MRLILESAPEGTDPATDIAIAQAILRQASRGEIGETVRISRPRTRTIAFGRSDLRRPGIDEAVRVCRSAGFAPVVRGSGGRAAAYTEAALVIDHISPDPNPNALMRQRFRDHGVLIAGVLGGLGVDARVGEVPGEYCPGEFSVNGRGRVKLVGTAQRVVRNAWLFSAVVVFGGGPELRALLPLVHERLDLPFEADSVGSVVEEVPGLEIGDVEAAFIDFHTRSGDVERASLDAATLDQAAALLPEHTVA